MKSVVLLSAGLDSSYNLIKAVKEGSVRLALTFDYGQRAARRERDQAQKLCEHFQVPHEAIELKWFSQFSQSSLTDRNHPLPLAEEVKIDDFNQSKTTAERVWVPNRNGIFLNIAAGFAEGLGADQVIAGFNLEEAQTFADNSEAFLQASEKAFQFSTQSRVKVFSYSLSMNKAQILESYLQGGGLKKWLWPCYEGFDSWCGQCESCLRFDAAEKAVAAQNAKRNY